MAIRIAYVNWVQYLVRYDIKNDGSYVSSNKEDLSSPSFTWARIDDSDSNGDICWSANVRIEYGRDCNQGPRSSQDWRFTCVCPMEIRHREQKSEKDREMEIEKWWQK